MIDEMIMQLTPVNATVAGAVFSRWGADAKHAETDLENMSRHRSSPQAFLLYFRGW